MALLKLRRHTYFLDVSTIAVEEVSAGRFKVVYDRVIADDGEVISEGREFLVIGGRASGGSAREWFVNHPEMFGDKWIPHSSMIAAIRMGACY